MVPVEISHGFGAAGEQRVLCAASRMFEVGGVVIKKLDATSLENARFRELATWLGEVLSAIDGHGFRLVQPVRASNGRWIVGGEWAAWRYVPGRPMSPADVGAVIPAIRALHRSLSHVRKHPALDTNATA